MLSGKVAIVTGASRGIGKAIALELASEGVHIAAIYDRSREETEKVCTLCESRFHVKAKAYACNVADFGCTKNVAASVKEAFGQIHILVNNAGITRDGLAVMMSEEDYDSVLDTNLKGAFLMTRHCLPFFVRGKEGCIINISSISGITGNAGQCNYAASKAGLIGFTKSIAKEYASRGIRCNAIAPGYIETEMTKDLEKPGLVEGIPLGRMGSVEDVARAVSYLAQAAYITGEVLRVDGGAGM